MGEGPNEEAQKVQVTDKLVESKLLQATARLSMVLALPVVTLISTLGGSWLDGKFSLQQAKIDNLVQQRVNDQTLTTKTIEGIQHDMIRRTENNGSAANNLSQQVVRLNDKLIAVETKQANDAQAFDRFQQATLTRLDRLQDSMVGMSNAIATLTATVQALIESNGADRAKRMP